MTRILIRCDASLLIGSGHVMRCRTLARELQRRGTEIIFLCRRQPGDLISLLEQEFTVLALPEQPLSSCDGLEGRDLYRAWLGCSQHEDASQCLHALDEAGITSVCWLVVDHYGLDACWEKQLHAGLAGSVVAPRLLVIDDLADRHHEANLLLDQNFFGEVTYHRYQSLVPSHCHQLLGPHYALLGPEYTQLHHLIAPRKELRRILVFFGGVDRTNLTSRALQALMHPSLSYLAVDVVLGTNSIHYQEVIELVDSRPNTTLHGSLPSLAALIARADLAIGAVGATTWERSCLRLPCLEVSIADNQLSFAEPLHQAGHLQLLGSDANVDAEQICAALLTRIADSQPAEVARPLTDGWGAQRLAMAMLGKQGPIRLRPLVLTDEPLLLRWAEDKQSYAKSSSAEPLAPIDSHSLRKGLAGQNCLMFIATTADGCPIGQLLLDFHTVSAEQCPAKVNFGLSLDQCVYGKGLLPELVLLGLQSIEQSRAVVIDSPNELLSGNDANNSFFVSSPLINEPDSVSVTSMHAASQEHAMEPGCITLLSDRGSWLNAFLPDLIISLWKRGHSVRWIHTPSALAPGDVCLLLSCGSLLTSKQLELHKHNLVVHASDLPHGQGWSPMTWQILEGISSIPITLFEAVADLDAGSVYLQRRISLLGHELAEEWRALLVRATFDLCLTWFDEYQQVVSIAQPQHGEASYYRRRRPADSELDPELSLADQFNILRVVDNERYPAFFNWQNKRYDITIQRS